MSTFNETPTGFDHFKPEVTYKDVRDIAQEGIQAAEKDPQGVELLAEFLKGNGPLVVGMIDTLARTVDSLLDQLENAQEVAA